MFFKEHHQVTALQEYTSSIGKYLYNVFYYYLYQVSIDKYPYKVFYYYLYKLFFIYYVAEAIAWMCFIKKLFWIFLSWKAIAMETFLLK